MPNSHDADATQLSPTVESQLRRRRELAIKERSHWRSEQPSEQLVFLTNVQTAGRPDRQYDPLL